MKYLCLICAETLMEGMTSADRDAHFEEYRVFTDAIHASGHLLGCHRLQPPEAATTVRVRQGKVSATDGPFAETKEKFGGFYLIEAADMDEAVGIASRIPGARFGCVEVRPIAEDPQTVRAIEVNART